MVEESGKKKFWRRRNPFFDLFSEFDRMDEMMDEMMKRAFEGMDISKTAKKPLVYGFSLKVGPDGKPRIQEFGNMQPTEQKINVRKEREPLVDVIDKGSEYDVLVEMPGVDKDEIQVNATEDSLTVQAPNKFFKQVSFKEKVNKDEVHATYKNGVLTVTLKKVTPKKGGKKVRVK